MKQAMPLGFILLTLLSLTTFPPGNAARALESEQFKIEGSTILQDAEDKMTPAVPVQTDRRRSGRLVKEGFSALIGEAPIRASLSKTNLDFSDSPKAGVNIAESAVKIMYTESGSYAIYAGERQGAHTTTVFHATGCDSDTNKCFTRYARPWLKLDVFGFGYSVSGPGTAQDIVNEAYFRPFQVLTSQSPAGNMIAEWQAKEAAFNLKLKLNQARPEQGSFSQPVVITVLHDW